MDTKKLIAAPEHKGLRLDSFISTVEPDLSRSRAKALVQEGAVTIDGAETKDPRKAIVVGSIYRITVPEPVPAIPQPENIPLEILFEDDHLIILNKAAGMTVHPGAGNWDGTLVNALLHHCEGELSGIGGVERPGIVHRLDKLTSGVMVAAKTEPTHVGLSALFAAHDIERAYLAVTRGSPRPLSGTVDEHLARSSSDRKKMAVLRNPESGHGRHAITHYKAKESYGMKDRGTGLPAAVLMECRLETGRTHQIRVHMAHIGAPLIGDPVYGRGKGISAFGSGPKYDDAITVSRAFKRQALHAAVLGFEHPITKETLRFEAPLPDDMVELIAALKRLPRDIRTD